MDISELLESIDIVEYISQFVELEEKGGEFWGLSPFRNENTPSFSIRRETGMFYDFSTGIGGSMVTFVSRYNHCSNAEAIEILKKYAGCDDENGTIKEKFLASKICRRFAPKKQKVNRSNPTIFKDNHMEIYENRQEKLEIWRQNGISNETLVKFQVRYDSFSDRIVYPIRSVDGKIINVGGRTLDPLWKQKKLRKYTYFHSWGGSMNTIYGLAENKSEILKAGEIILFEGCKSVLLADTWGIKNTGAVLTSHLSPNQMIILAKLGCRVVFALDKEVRIKDDKNIQKLRSYVPVEFIWDRWDLLDEKDAPVDKGKEVFMKLYDGRLRYR